MHIFINPKENFEPSTVSKKRWLATKKAKMQFGKIVLPGFYQTSNFKTHSVLVMLVAGIELYGFYILFNVLPNPMYSLLFTFTDFILAILSHLNKGNICYQKNIRLLAENGISRTVGKAPEGERSLQNGKILKNRIFENIFYLVIVIFAILKIYNTLHYGSFIVLGLRVFICILYAIAAVIHITVTGYFFAELWFRYGVFFGGVRKERLNTIHNTELIDEKVTMYWPIDLCEKYSDVRLRENKHKIESTIDGKSSILYIWGILQDDDLNQLVTAQSGSKQGELALKLLQLQIKSLDQTTWRAETIEPEKFPEAVESKNNNPS